MYINDVPNELLFLKDENYPTTQLLGLGQETSKGMFCLNHSNEQTTPISASNLQCSILIVLKRYQAGTCFPLSDGSATILFMSQTWLHNVCPITKHPNLLLQGGFYLFCNFQWVGDNEPKHLFDSMVKALRLMWGNLQCTSHLVLPLWRHVPPDGLANVQSFRFQRGWRQTQIVSLRVHGVGSVFLHLSLHLLFQGVNISFHCVFSFSMPASFTTLLVCCYASSPFPSPYIFELRLGYPPLC